MSVLPSNTFLGKLELTEVYEYYGKPLLFACRNASGTHYVAVQADEGGGIEKWLYMSISASRLQQVRSGVIDLHDAFMGAEDGFVFHVTMTDDARMPVEVGVISVAELKDEPLPDVGERLALEPAGMG